MSLWSAAALADSKPEKTPPPPSEAQWTIQCRVFTGENRIAEAMRVRDYLRKQTGEKTWYLLHTDNDTTLFFGYYRSIQVEGSDGKDRKDAERAHSDRKRITALRDEQGQPLFSDAFFAPVDSVGESGPREWNIINSPAEYQWTLLIGVYRDNPERKKAAAEAVRKLRSEKVEAYYYHGEMMSFVFIGRWEAKSVYVETADTARTSQSADEEVMVTDRWLDSSVPTVYKGPNGKTVRLVNPRLTIQDTSVKETMAKFPNFHINGEVMGRRVKDKEGNERVVYDQSTLTAIPRREQSVLNADTPSQPPAVQLIAPPGSTPKTTGAGSLKALDEK